MDKEMDRATAEGKRDAARRWANYVTADEKVDVLGAICSRPKWTLRRRKGARAALKALRDS